MRRRKFVTLLGRAVALALAARAQQAAMPVIGFLSITFAGEQPDWLAALRMVSVKVGISRATMTLVWEKLK